MRYVNFSPVPYIAELSDSCPPTKHSNAKKFSSLYPAPLVPQTVNTTFILWF